MDINLHLNIDIHKVWGLWSLSSPQSDPMKFFDPPVIVLRIDLARSCAATGSQRSALRWGPGNVPPVWGFPPEVETIASLVEACQQGRSRAMQGYLGVWRRVNQKNCA